MRETININGDLNAEETKILQEISEKSLEKMQKRLHNVTGMNIKVKTYHQEGKNKKFSVISSLNLGSRKFEANAEDWKIVKALKGSLKGLSNEVEHSFHLSSKSHVTKSR
jgi:hypothetical protein